MIEGIRLKNFRKHDDLCLEFDDEFNLIYGRNNAGKSTVFYGIEYCLFGNVLGFKKISQLATYKANAVGVELIFKSKNGERYKLQRIHKLSGKHRSAKGSYTLKKIYDDSESYVISSDFGDREEDLSLKINELMGISKRFFETGIHFHQGTISEILAGSKKLDIVFGITAATTLADIFRARALEFEKEAQNIDTLRIMLDQYRKEKMEQKDKLQTQEGKLKEIQNEVQNKEKQLKSFKIFKESTEKISNSVESYEETKRKFEDIKLKEDMVKKEFEVSKKNFGTQSSLKKKQTSIKKKLTDNNNKLISADTEIETILKEIRELENKKIETENVIKQLNDISEELKILIEDVGKKEELSKKLKTQSNQMEIISKKISTLEKEVEGLQNFFRDAERENGDIEGILKRREQAKDKPKCEYCGASIEHKKIESEMKSLKEKLQELRNKIKSNENTEKEVKNELKNLREEEKTLNSEILTIKNSIQKIENLEEKKGKLSSDEELDQKLNTIKDSILSKEKTVEKNKKQLEELRGTEKELENELHTIENQISRLKELDYKIKEFKAEITVAEKSCQTEEENLFKNFASTKQRIEEKIEKTSKESSKEQKYLNDTLSQIAKKMEVKKEELSLEYIIKIRDELTELIITKISEISTILEHLKNQENEINENLNEIRNQIINLDKNFAAIEKEIILLNKKEVLAEKYRNFHKIFVEVQTIIRQNASKVLEKQILSLHQQLSSDDEFKKVIIDNENYSLSVVPKEMVSDEFYPAAVYQGGGHKLILGLAYKIALGDLIGRPPFLLIDEPTEFMDSNNRITLLSNINTLSENTQVMLITHQDVEKITCNKKIKIER